MELVNVAKVIQQHGAGVSIEYPGLLVMQCGPFEVWFGDQNGTWTGEVWVTGEMGVPLPAGVPAVLDTQVEAEEEDPTRVARAILLATLGFADRWCPRGGTA